MPIKSLSRPGFTLAEMILALFIFSFMAASLATIYATANRHMFQNYRNNTIKTNADFAMKVIQNKLAQATRIDVPAAGAAGNQLAIAENVDQASGCYPIQYGVPVVWHYFCTAADSIDPSVVDLYYHTGQISSGGGSNGCQSDAPTIWGATYPVPTCGLSSPGQTVTILMQYVENPAGGSGRLFSRSSLDGIIELDLLSVNLRSHWEAATRGFGTKQRQRDIDFTIRSVQKVNRAAF